MTKFRPCDTATQSSLGVFVALRRRRLLRTGRRPARVVVPLEYEFDLSSPPSRANHFWPRRLDCAALLRSISKAPILSSLETASLSKHSTRNFGSGSVDVRQRLRENLAPLGVDGLVLYSRMEGHIGTREREFTVGIARAAHCSTKFLSFTASSRPSLRPTRNSFGALSGNLGGANGFQAFVGEWRHCAMTSIAPPVSRAYHFRSGSPLRSRSVSKPISTFPIGSFLLTASQSCTFSVSEGWSLLDDGDTLHWNCSWKAGSRVFFDRRFLGFLGRRQLHFHEGVRRTRAQYQPRVGDRPPRRRAIACRWRRRATI